MYLFLIIALLFVNSINGQSTVVSTLGIYPTNDNNQHATDISCTCGVFLTSQFVKGSNKQPTGDPPILSEIDETFPCNNFGIKQCTSKCMESLAIYLPNSANMICASTDRDIFRERAFLFVKNCNSGWTNTRLSGGQEYCCKNTEHYKCSKVAA